VGTLFPIDKKQHLQQVKYRPEGRLMAYSFKRKAQHGLSPNIFLDDASMISPLVAILFLPTLDLREDQLLRLNDWLLLQVDVPADADPQLRENAARILFELRKTLDRFVGLAWMELEKLINPGARLPTLPNGTVHRLGAAMRKIMVNSVVQMLDADDAYWKKFRSERRAWIQNRSDSRLEIGHKLQVRLPGNAKPTLRSNRSLARSVMVQPKNQPKMKRKRTPSQWKLKSASPPTRHSSHSGSNQ
jgi:hypothetical protein